MKRWILPAALLAGLLVWVLLGQGREATSSSSLEAPVRTHADFPASAGETAAVLSTRTPGHLDRITSLSGLAALAKAARPEDRAQALSELLFAATVCQNLGFQKSRTQREITGRMGATEIASLQWLRGFHGRFCDGPPDLYQDTLLQVQKEQDLDQDVYQAMGLRLLEDTEVESVGVPRARSLLQSNQPDAMERAASFLRGTGHDLVDMDGRLPAALDSAEKRNDVQWLAVQIAACRARGGCGPGGIHTAAWCGRHCAQGRSLMEAWRLKYPPQVLQVATDISRELGPRSGEASAAE